MITLPGLMNPPTTEQVKAKIYDVMGIVGVNTTTWKPGAVVRTMIAALSIMVAFGFAMVGKIARGAFLETAAGGWLTLCARYVFGVERELATFAAGSATLVNSGGGVYTVDPGDLILSNPDTGKTYRNTSAFTLNGLATLIIPIVANEAGAASTAVPNGISVLETPLAGVTVTNAAALVGLDEESDAVLKSRCEAKLGSLSPNGPWDAYAFIAKSSKRSDGTTIGVTRTRVVPDGYGNVELYVATATGAVSGIASDPTTDLGAISDAIQRKSVPLAVTADVLSATAQTFALTYSVWMYNTSGRTNAEVQDAIETSVAAYLSMQPIGGNVISGGGKVYRSDLIGVIRAVFPEHIFRVDITTPALDVDVPAYAVLMLGTVNRTITQINPPVGH
jgi:phage-related baseplate assembly protein